MGKLVSTAIPGLKRRGNSFVIDKTVKGVRIFKAIPTTELSVAQKIMCRVINDALEGKYLSARQSSLTVQDVLNSYWDEHLRHKDYAKDTKYILAAVADRLGEIPVHDLKKFHIMQYKRDRALDKKKNRCKGTVSPRTIQKELQHLSMAIESAFTNAVKRAGLEGRGISPYALRRTRITIWDEIDSTAARYATGHLSKRCSYPSLRKNQARTVV